MIIRIWLTRWATACRAGGRVRVAKYRPFDLLSLLLRQVLNNSDTPAACSQDLCLRDAYYGTVTAPVTALMPLLSDRNED